MKNIQLGSSILGQDQLFLIAGPCVIESRDHSLFMAKELKKITQKFSVPFIYKSSFDKANRTSHKSFRGIGIEQGLEILSEVRQTLQIPVLTDVHGVKDVEMAQEVVDVLQIPAFLCRQTDLLLAAGSTGKTINIKKGQFLAPWDMKHIVEKLEHAGCYNMLLTDRGVSFGYNNLVSDMRAIPIMKEFGYPVVFDATHSVQLPGGQGGSSGGERRFIEPLSRASIAAGADGLFFEVHQDPDHAPSDGPNMVPLNKFEKLLEELIALHKLVRMFKKE